MKSFRIPVFKKIVGAINKALGNDEVAIVPRADGIYVVYKEDGTSVEKKIYDQRHNTEIAGMATGLGENVGAIRNSFIPGESVRAEELCSVSSGEPTEASVTGTTSISLIDDFITLRDNNDNGKISFSVNGIEYSNIPLSLETKEFNKEEVVNHVNYAGTQTATSSRGMTIQIPSSLEQGLIKSFKIYLKAGKTYTVKTYRGDTLTDKVDEQTVVASETKFHTVTLDTPHILNNNEKITIIVEASSFDYYYPASTAAYTESWSDGSKDSPFSILKTIPIKLDVYPCIALNPNEIESVVRFVKDKINETITDQVSYLFTDRIKLYFAPGFLQFETKSSDSVDILDMLGFKSGRVTVHGEGYEGVAAAGKILRADENGGVPLRIDPNNRVYPEEAKLIGGTDIADLSVFQAIGSSSNNGKFSIEINNIVRDNVEVNLSGVSSLEEIAANIQSGIRAKTSSTETVRISSLAKKISSGDSQLGSNVHNPGTNFGSADLMRLGGWSDVHVGVVKFDINDLPGSADKCYINLYIPANVGTSQYNNMAGTKWNRIEADWEEMTITMNNAPAGCGNNTGTLVSLPSNGNWLKIDITTLYNQWKDGTYGNYGIALTGNENTYMNKFCFFATKEYADLSKRPFIEVLKNGYSFIEISTATKSRASRIKRATQPSSGQDLSNLLSIGNEATEIRGKGEDGLSVVVNSSGKIPSHLIP